MKFEHRAILSAPANVIFEAVSGRARKNGFSIDQTDTRLVVTAPLGLVTLVDTGKGIDLSLKAETPEKLQFFRTSTHSVLLNLA